MSAQSQDQIGGKPIGTTGLILFGVGASLAIVGGAYVIGKSIREAWQGDLPSPSVQYALRGKR